MLFLDEFANQSYTRKIVFPVRCHFQFFTQIVARVVHAHVFAFNPKTTLGCIIHFALVNKPCGRPVFTVVLLKFLFCYFS